MQDGQMNDDINTASDLIGKLTNQHTPEASVQSKSTQESTECFERISTPSSLEISPHKITSVNKKVRLSDNPFDLLSGAKYASVECVNRQENKPEISTSDDFILSRLKKSKTDSFGHKFTRKNGIFKKINILSKDELFLTQKKYFKFPFDAEMINDESPIFKAIRSEFSIAFGSAYSNYRKFGEAFSVVLSEGSLLFSDSGIRCSNSLARLLKSNEIGFTEEEECIVVHDNDSGLVYDIIMNIDISKGKRIPFVFSKFEFENGIVFRTKIKKGPVVRNGFITEYSYSLLGPVDARDYHFDDDVFLEYVD